MVMRHSVISSFHCFPSVIRQQAHVGSSRVSIRNKNYIIFFTSGSYKSRQKIKVLIEIVHVQRCS